MPDQALPSDPTSRDIREIETFLQEAHARQLISDKEMQYFFNLSAIWPVFYILLKVHKSLVNPLEQPIVAGNNRLTESPLEFC